MKYNVKTLSSLNLGAGILQLISAIGLIIYAILYFDASENTIDTSTYNVSLTTCNNDDINSCDVISSNNGYNVTTTKNFDSSTETLVVLVILFAVLTSIFHFVIYSKKSYYENAINKGNNILRWIEYSITATIMVILIAFTVGIKETASLALMVCASIVTMLMGNLTERSFSNNDSFSTIMLISLAFFLISAVFGIIFWQYAELVEDVPNIPTFVTPIVILEFILFMSFGVVQALYISKIIDYSQGEIGFITLSFTSKVLLSWLLFAGIVIR